MLRRSACFLIALMPAVLMARKEWREGQLLSVEVKDFERGKNHIDHRYVCTVAAGELLYTVEFEKPLKAIVHEPVKFAIDKDKLIILDSDRKERSATIEKRERAAPNQPQLSERN